MSEFVDVEWFGRKHTIGIVLTYDEQDGFKVRMAPIPSIANHFSESRRMIAEDEREILDAKWIMKNAAKIPFEWAWGIFGRRMKAEWESRHLADGAAKVIRYDHRDYDVNTLQEVKP